MAVDPLISGARSQQRDIDGQAVVVGRMTHVCRGSLGATVLQNLYLAGTDGLQPLSSQYKKLLRCMRVGDCQLTGLLHSTGGQVSTAQTGQIVPPTRNTGHLLIAPQTDEHGQVMSPLKGQAGQLVKLVLQLQTLLKWTKVDPLTLGSSTIPSQQGGTTSPVIAPKLPLQLRAATTGVRAVSTMLKQLAMAGKVIVMHREDGRHTG